MKLPRGFFSVHVRPTQNEHEVREAQRIIHDSYVAAGYIKPQLDGLWTTPFDATKTTFVALVGKEIVGTIGLFTGYHLPVDETINSNDWDRYATPVGEIGGLAVTRKHRGSGVFILMVMAIVYHLRNTLKVPRIVIQVHPRHAKFYMRYLPFKLVSFDVLPCTITNHAPATVLIVNNKDYEKMALNSLIFRLVSFVYMLANRAQSFR